MKQTLMPGFRCDHCDFKSLSDFEVRDHEKTHLQDICKHEFYVYYFEFERWENHAVQGITRVCTDCNQRTTMELSSYDSEAMAKIWEALDVPRWPAS